MLKRGESADSAATAPGAEWNPKPSARSLAFGAADLRAGSDGLTNAESGGEPRRTDRAEDRSTDAILAIAHDAFTLAPAARLVGASAAMLHRALRRIESTLSDGLPVESVLGVRYRRLVSIALEDPAEPTAPSAAKFGFRMRLPRSGSLATVVLDRPACEALCNVFMAFYAPLRGYGDPTRVETALLEFATTLTIAELRREGVEPAGDAALVGFLEKSELTAQGGTGGVSLPLRVAVDQREGRATLILPDAHAESARRVFPSAKRVDARVDLRSSVEVRIALPSIELGVDEWKDAALGDVLLLGATDLSAITSCSLVSDTGWRLAPAKIEFDSPSTLSTELCALDPDVFALEPSATGFVRVVPTIGASRVTLEQIASWSTGARIDLPKSTALPVSIFHGGVELARGELVRADGEIGIRLGAIYRKELLP